MAKTLCKIAGAVMLLAGLAGFAMPHLLGMHLTLVHNVVHLATGAIALYLGFAGSAGAARMFCIVFGAVYLLLGIVGFVAPGIVAAIIMHTGDLNFMPDNVVHVLLGIVFLGVGLASKETAR